MTGISSYLYSALAALIALTVHEYSHGYAAYRLGDPTAKVMGRLSLNPLRHLDPIGALCLVFFHFGWAKPVPINPNNFKKPKRDFALTALAGPVSNFVLSFFSAFFYLLCFTFFSAITFPNAGMLRVAQNILYFLYAFHLVNLGLALFNLFPLPPLDGSRLLGVILPEKAYFGIMKYERTIYFIMLGWMFFGSAAASLLMAIPGAAEIPALSLIAEILSFSGLFGKLIALVSDGMMKLFALLPFIRSDILAIII